MGYYDVPALQPPKQNNEIANAFQMIQKFLSTQSEVNRNRQAQELFNIKKQELERETASRDAIANYMKSGDTNLIPEIARLNPDMAMKVQEVYGKDKEKMSKLIGQSIAAIYATPPEKRAEAWPELRNVIVTANPSMAEKIPETFDQKWVDVNSMSIIGPDAWRQLQQKKNIKMHTWQEGGDKVFGGVDEDEGKVAFEIARGPAKEVKTEDIGKKRQYWLNEITKHTKSLETIGKATKLDQLTAILGKDFGIGMPETLTDEAREKASIPIRNAIDNAKNELKKLEGSSMPASSKKAAVGKYKTKEEVRRDFKLGKFGPPESEEAQLKAQAAIMALES